MSSLLVPPSLTQNYDVCFKTVPVGKWTKLNILAVRDPDRLIDALDPDDFQEDERLPYWAEIWPSAIGMGMHLFDYPVPPGTQVLELGCGIGVAGIAAAAAGLEILACDYEQDALEFARYNAALNRTPGRIRYRQMDWRSPDLEEQYAVIIASDILYERPNHEPVMALINRALSPGGMFLTSDPNRRAAEPFVAAMKQQGYRHSVQQRWVRFETINTKINIHRFIKKGSIEYRVQSTE